MVGFLHVTSTIVHSLATPFIDRTVLKKPLVITYMHTVFSGQIATALGELGFFKQKWTYLPILKLFQQKRSAVT